MKSENMIAQNMIRRQATAMNTPEMTHHLLWQGTAASSHWVQG